MLKTFLVRGLVPFASFIMQTQVDCGYVDTIGEKIVRSVALIFLLKKLERRLSSLVDPTETRNRQTLVDIIDLLNDYLTLVARKVANKFLTTWRWFYVLHGL